MIEILVESVSSFRRSFEGKTVPDLFPVLDCPVLVNLRLRFPFLADESDVKPSASEILKVLKVAYVGGP